MRRDASTQAEVEDAEPERGADETGIVKGGAHASFSQIHYEFSFTTKFVAFSIVRSYEESMKWKLGKE